MSDLPAVRLHLAPFSDLERPEKPSASYFLAPLLHTLAVESAYRPRVFFDSNVNDTGRDPLKDKVLQVAGYDPFDESSLPFPLRETKAPMGMYRRIWFAFQERTDAYLSRVPKKGTAALRLFCREDDKWGLTEVGVAVAAQIRSSFVSDSNVTQAWLQGMLTREVYAGLIRDLSRSPRLCRETEDDIHGHLSQYLASVIRKDTFRDRILQGHPPTPRQIKEWVLNRAISTFRHRSRTPLGREMYGARTKEERVSGSIAVSAQAVSNFSKVLQGDMEDSTAAPQEVIVDTEATERMEHRLAFGNVMDRFRTRVFQLFKPGAAERYERIYHWMVDGISQQELAEREGVAQNRAANLMAEVRTVLRKASQATTDARRVLEYLQEEPYSTLEDLQEDLDLSTDLAFLLSVLVDRGRIQETRGSYTATPQGASFLQQFEGAGSGDVMLQLSL